MRLELKASPFRFYLHWALMALTISSGAWLMAYGGPDIAQVWFPEHPIMSTLGMFSFLAWVLNIVQMGLNSND